tara:strand:- start:48 stop:980 length:933 start_codon:yes stop_codon:yes gene_type:complete
MRLKAIFFLVVGIFCISITDAIFKSLSGSYALHELVFIRATISLALMLPVVLILNGLRSLRTSQPGLHALRGLLIVIANLAFFTGLASLPLAEASAIVFLSPVFTTLFAAIFLRELVTIVRVTAVVVGLIGMVLVVQPLSPETTMAFLWPLAAAICYAAFVIVTRFIAKVEGVSGLAVYSVLAFLVSSGLIGLLVGNGSYSGNADPSIEFLLRAWQWPEFSDWGFLIGIGILSTVIAFAMAAAYRSGEASFLAPFEYVNLPFVLLWGLLFFGEFPNRLALMGMVLIVLGGVVMVIKEGKNRHQSKVSLEH